MSINATCPNHDVLEQYARNTLADAHTGLVDVHLETCRSCLEHVLELGERSRHPEIPDCHIVKEIGRGRFGVVYKAWSLAGTPRIVALKVLSYPGEMETSRFEREIAVLKRIDSPGVVKCLDSGVTQDAHYFVMDFIEGVHLDEYLAKHTSTLEEKLGVFQRACRAVADAHTVGVIHRDLKPRNILVDANGQPHILDFGICTVEPEAWSSWLLGTITHAGDVIGTLRYMSPEQAWGGVAGPIDERSDVWALGILLYEIVTDGDYPYLLSSTADEPVHEALLNRIRKELPDLPKLQYLPRGADLEVLLERCLVWEPDQRIQKVHTLERDIEAYCAGRRIATRRLGPVYRAKRLAIGAATRSRFAFAASFVAAIGMLFWVVVAMLPIGWNVDGRWYRGDGAPVDLGTLAEARARIGVIGIYDETPASLVAYAHRANLPDVGTSAVSWRPVHGVLMRRLITARPRAVAWDFFFESTQPHDRMLVEAASELEQSGIPVSFAVERYQDDGAPRLTPELTAQLGQQFRYGAIVARDMVARPGEFVLAVKRPDGLILHHLALTTLASIIMPESRVDLDWSSRHNKLHLLHRLEPGSYSRVRNEMRLTKSTVSEDTWPAVRPGDLLGCALFPLRDPGDWAKQTVRYEDVLEMPEAQLVALMQDKVVVIGDFRTAALSGSSDRHSVKYAMSVQHGVPGCYLLADAIAGLMSRRHKTWAMPPPPTTFLSMLGLAALATLLPIRFASLHALDRPRVRRGLIAGLCFIGTAALCVMPSLDTFWGVHAAIAAFAISLPMAGSLMVEFARNRHRIADRARREIETLRLPSDGTVTLVP